MIVIVKVSIDFLWLFPTWLVIIIAVEGAIGYDALKALGMSEKLWEVLGQVQGSVEKVTQMIPKHRKLQ